MVTSQSRRVPPTISPSMRDIHRTGTFKEYFEQPWLALDDSERKRKDQLSSWCKFGGIPSFVVFDKDVTLITRDGRAAVLWGSDWRRVPVVSKARWGT